MWDMGIMDKSINASDGLLNADYWQHYGRNWYYNRDCMATYTGTPYYLLINEGGTGVTSQNSTETQI